MSFTPIEECSTLIKSCNPRLCTDDNSCYTVKNTDGPNGYSHNVNSDYSIVVGGVTIPVAKTIRKFTVSFGTNYGLPTLKGYYGASWGIMPLICTEKPADTQYLIVSDNCVIEKSTLYHLDHRHGVCLYRYQKEALNMAVSSSEMAAIKEPWGISQYHQAQIKTQNYTATRLVEWRLVVDGVQKVLKTTTTALHPFGPKNSGLASGTGLFPDFKPDPETRMVLLFPTPPSMGIPWSDVLCRLGCYEFGYDTPEGVESAQNAADGGNKDHFYPEWCRNLQQDPFWRKAADNRYMVDWFHADLTDDKSYVPPYVTVNPLPCGTYANHPTVGEAYQFICDDDGVFTEPDFNKLIDAALPDGLNTSGTTLYYPIGVV